MLFGIYFVNTFMYMNNKRLLLKLFTFSFLVSAFLLFPFTLAPAVFADAPDCTITAPAEVAAGPEGNTASVASAGSGARYFWTINNGVITHANANTIKWSAGTASPVTISITVISGDCLSCQDSVAVAVNPLPGCSINAPASVRAGSTGHNASVTGGGAGASYVWTIGNGTITAGAGTSAITWSAGSSSPVTISVTVTDGSGNSCKDTANVVVNPLPHADFTASPVSGCVPLTVQFTDTSTYCPSSWSWNFGDGGTSEQRNPSHQYANTGVFNVSLTVTNSYGSDTETKSAYITAQSCTTAPPPSPPEEDFSEQLIREEPTQESSNWSWAQPSNVMVTNTWADPRTARAGQKITIYANMANRGDIQGTYTATLKIDGKVEETKRGSLEGNTAVPLQFYVSRDRPGTYRVDVNGQETYFTVIADSEHTKSHLAWIIGVILLFALATVILVVRRRRMSHHSV